MSDIKVEKKIDLSGLPCPMPIVKISKEIKTIEVGQILEAKTTDPGALSDFPAWAQSSGNEIVKVEESADGATFYVKRTA
jgi:tRNA 2-thiouridine synthesizing protein A